MNTKRILWLLLAFLPFAGMGTTYTVNSLANTNTGAGTSGTLRYCVTQANLVVGPHTINFSVAGTINIAADANVIPTLNRTITIDGSTAPGFAGTPVIILNGTGCIAINGLTIAAANCQIYGLEIRNFPYRGVHLSSATASGCTFGAAGKGNVVRNNGYYGIQLSGADNCIIAHNRVGVTADGSTCAANGYDGIDLTGSANNNQILNNHISCNGYNGLQIGGNSDFNIVKGNTIGPLTATCSNNGYRGVDIEGGSNDNVVGGTAPGEANKISGNLYWGIEVKEAGSINNIISGNSISCNDYGGIEVNTGGNINIAAPTITAASTTTVSGTSLGNSIIEVFRAQDPALIICPMAPTPNNQGIDYLGTTTATAGGAWTLSGTFNGSVVATQRDAAGNTSRFSAAVSTGVAASFVSNCPGTIALDAGDIRQFSVNCSGDQQAVIQIQLTDRHELAKLQLEGSIDGTNFHFIHGWETLDILSLAHQYRLPSPGDSWFRLKQISLDGEQQYSRIQTLPANSCDPGFQSLGVYPNPSNGEINISLQGSGTGRLQLMDSKGQLVRSQNFLVQGNHSETWNLDGLPRGIYLVSFTMGGKLLAERLVLQ